MSKNIRIFSILLLLQTVIISAQTNVTNYLNGAETIKVDNVLYELAWSSHPTENYYKHEYLRTNETLENYSRMVLIDFLKGDFKIEDVVHQKINELENLKIKNPIVNYKVYENNGEFILDFLLSENSKDGEKILIIERNAYRYQLIPTANNGNSLLLFAISERGYENNLDEFFSNLKTKNNELIETIGNYDLSKIQLK